MNSSWIRFVVSVAVSVLILWLLLRFIGSSSNPVSFKDLVRVLGDVSVSTFAWFLAVHLLGVVLRTLRFRLLIRASQSEIVPSFGPLCLVTLVRNMTVDMLPARLGELFYVGLLNRGLGVPPGPCFSSLALAIWFDLMVIVPLAMGLVLYPALDTGVHHHLFAVAVALILVCAAGFVILNWGLDAAAAWLARLPRGGSRLLESVRNFVDQFAHSVKQSLSRDVILKTFLLTVGVRVCKYSSIVLLFGGIARAGFPDLAGADPGKVVIGLLASEAGASLPIPTFMGFGTYEAGGLAAFAMLGLPVAAAGLALFTIHIVTQTVDYVLGGLAFAAFLITTGTAPSAVAGSPGRRP